MPYLQLQHILEALQKIAPLSHAQPWDNVGLLVGDSLHQEIHNILLCVTLTPAVLAEACARKTHLVVSHHPFPFHPLRHLNTHHAHFAEAHAAKMLRTLIEHNISLYSAHTAYDNCPHGINEQILAATVEAQAPPQDLVLSSSSSPSSAPSQRSSIPAAGKYIHVKDLNLHDVIARAKHYFQGASLPVIMAHAATNSTKDPSSVSKSITISKAAAVCGMGSSCVNTVITEHCDLFICGELRYHECLQLQAHGCHTILPGHFHSEKPGMSHLALQLQEQFSQLSIFSADNDIPCEDLF